MSDPLAVSGTIAHRRGIARIYAPEAIHPDELLELLRQPGEVLKQSSKSAVRRVEDCIIKESRGGVGLGMVKHTLWRERYRRGWLAAHRLRAQGVGVPEPLAFVERRALGMVFGNAMVSEYLEGQRNVEDFLRAITQRGAGRDTVVHFLANLADAVNRIEQANAHHTDLSGKNIFTRDGVSFRFIDLDAVILDRPCDESMRMKNHVQLYDSFCDRLNDSLLVPFITRMLPAEHDPRVWMPKVRKLQRQRRHRIEEKWARQEKRAP